MLSPLTRQELMTRRDNLTKNIGNRQRELTEKQNEVACLTRDLEADQEMRELLTERLDADLAEQRTIREAERAASHALETS